MPAAARPRQPHGGGPGQAGDPPWTVRGAAGVALAEAIGSAVFVIRFVADVLPFEDPWLTHVGYAFGVVVLVVAAVVALVAAGLALLKLRHWPRSLLVVAQLLALAIGIPMVQGGDWAGWPAIVLGVAGLVLTLHPRTTAAIEGEPSPS